MITSTIPFDAIELDTKKKLPVKKEKENYIIQINKPVIIVLKNKDMKTTKIFIPKKYEGEIIKIKEKKIWVEDGFLYSIKNK